MTESFYDVLGVSDEAATEEIETAYREAVKEVHPDVSDDEDASRRTKRLNKAKRVLTDEDERDRYDRLGHETYVDGGPGSGTGSTSGTGRGTARPGSGSSATTTSGPDASSRRERRSSGTATGSKRRHRENGGHRRRRSGANRTNDTGTAGSRTTNGGARTGSTAADGAGATRSRTDSTGPEWQSSGTGGTGGARSRSARRQAAAAGPDGTNVEWSWNSWSPQDAWAVRQDSAERGLAASRLFPPDQSLVLLASTFFCYPLFVASALFPGFPLVVRAIVAMCTLFMFAYLLSMPEVAIFVYGAWAVLATFALFAVPAVGLFSLVGVLALVATWIPLGISVLTFSILRT